MIVRLKHKGERADSEPEDEFSLKRDIVLAFRGPSLGEIKTAEEKMEKADVIFVDWWHTDIEDAKKFCESGIEINSENIEELLESTSFGQFTFYPVDYLKIIDNLLDAEKIIIGLKFPPDDKKEREVWNRLVELGCKRGKLNDDDFARFAELSEKGKVELFEKLLETYSDEEIFFDLSFINTDFLHHAVENYFDGFDMRNLQREYLGERLHTKYSPQEQKERYASTKAIFRHSKKEQKEILARLDEEQREFGLVGELWGLFYAGHDKLGYEDQETCGYYSTLNSKRWGVPGAKHRPITIDLAKKALDEINDLEVVNKEQKELKEGLEKFLEKNG
ncbi:MAG: hypothetical protein JXA43_01130 [Candidatus Diapherotrites archaeon]|nr:hypothetical protein [Candidatus Diapherotrites archaeon]